MSNSKMRVILSINFCFMELKSRSNGMIEGKILQNDTDYIILSNLTSSCFISIWYKGFNFPFE